MREMISVIVPAFNNGPWLPRCLDSLLAQTYDTLEILAVDDGSTDDTYAIMCAYAARDCRVKVIHKENGGVTSARLAGVAQAGGDWIGFVDGDDAVEPEMFARLLGNAHTYGADISHCGYRQDFPDGVVRFHYHSGEIRPQTRETALRDLLEGKIIEPGLWTKLFRKELFQNLEQKMDFSIKINEDLLMNWFLFLQAEKSIFEDFCPYHYVVREGSASRRRLNESRIYDPIRVKQIILDTCTPELREDACGAMVRTCLISYGLLSLETGREFDGDRKNVRRMLIAQKKYFSLLTRQNALLAGMICAVPWLFRLVYRVYVKCFQDEYE